MRRVIHPLSETKRIAAGLVFLLPAVVVQTVLVSSRPWWEIPFLRLAMIGLLAGISIWVLMRSLIRASEFADFWFFVVLGVWSVAFLASGTTSSTLSALVFGVTAFLWSGFLMIRAIRVLRRAAVDSGVLWFQGEPKCLPHTRAQILSLEGSILVQGLGVARVDQTGIFLVFPKNKTLPIEGNYRILVQTQGGDLDLEAQLYSFWSRGSARGAGFLLLQTGHFNAMKPFGDWLKQLEGFGYASS